MFAWPSSWVDFILETLWVLAGGGVAFSRGANRLAKNLPSAPSEPKIFFFGLTISDFETLKFQPTSGDLPPSDPHGSQLRCTQLAAAQPKLQKAITIKHSLAYLRDNDYD